jgi:hypothetical protein
VIEKIAIVLAINPSCLYSAWLEQRCTFIRKAASLAIGGDTCSDIEFCIPVHITHKRCFSFPILSRVLYYTQGVYPNELDP